MVVAALALRNSDRRVTDILHQNLTRGTFNWQKARFIISADGWVQVPPALPNLVLKCFSGGYDVMEA